jgi:hypothetical protein
MQRSHIEGLILACSVSLVGCVHVSTAADPSTETHAQYAKREVFRMFETACPSASGDTAAPAASSGTLRRPHRVFLDTAVFELPTGAAQEKSVDSSSTLIADPAVRLLGTPRIAAEAERSTIMLEERTGLLTSSTLNQLSVTATFTEDQRAVLDVEIVLQVPLARSSSSGELSTQKRRIRLLMAPRDRQHVRASAPIPDQPGRSLLVLLTPYFLHDDSDLRAVFECKMWQRQRTLEPER